MYVRVEEKPWCVSGASGRPSNITMQTNVVRVLSAFSDAAEQVVAAEAAAGTSRRVGEPGRREA